MEQEKYISSMQDAIKTRRSRRKYIPEPLDQSDVKILHEFIAEYNAKENLGRVVKRYIRDREVYRKI